MQGQLRGSLKSIRSDLVPHIFFPRELPTESTVHGIAKTESALLLLFSSVVQEVNDDLGNSFLSRTQKLFTKWNSIQLDNGFDVPLLSTEIESLEPGDSIALYVRAQNAGLILSMPEDGDTKHEHAQIILSAFAASQASKTVMGANGEIRATFPGYSYHVPKSALLQSESMAFQLSTLSKEAQDFAAPHTRKAGSSHQEIRDVSDPVFIAQWLPAVLSVETSDMCFHYKPVTKKIRDHVVIGKSTLPFRRSGLWMAAKVVLQLSLINEMKDEIQAKIMYKITMLRLFVTCAQIWNEDLDADIGMQVIAKIARRMLKLYDYISKNNVPEKLKKYFETTTKAAEESVLKIQKRLELQWKFYISTVSLKSELKYPAPTDFEEDTVHKLKKLTAYIKMLNGNNYAAPNQRVPNLPCPPRHRSTSWMFPIQNFEVPGEENIGIVLNDFERNIEKLDSFYNNDDVVQLRDLFETYGAKAKEYYTDDPVGGSKMILTLMKIIMVLDKLALKNYPLLAEYESGINPSIIQELILPGRKEMTRALELENYFLSRNNIAVCNSLIEEEQMSSQSFSVRYASGDSGMQLLKKKIQTQCEKLESDKRSEVLKSREECRNIRNRSAGLPHDFQKDYYDRNVHNEYRCTKCQLLKTAEATGVGIYERLLPANENSKNGVVFELMIPSDLACLRDMLFEFTQSLPSNGSIPRNAAVGFWINHLSQYQSESSKHQKYVKLGSSTKLYAQTHYNSRLHPDENMDSFIVNNGYNCNYFYNDDSNLPTILSGSTVKDFCTFTVNPSSPYKDLQFALRGSSHTQNEVLARQIECPSELSLSEFVEFGSLRAGHCLQWHNIYRALVQGTLSLETESVFSLICQTIWQAGPKLVTRDVSWRESDESILDPNFAIKTLELLSAELDTNSLNWKNDYFIAVIIVLANRIFSITEHKHVQETALQLLKKCRKVTTDWCTSIEELLSKMTLAPKEDVKEMRTKLVQIAGLSALTFTANPGDLMLVLHDSNDVQSWLRSIAKIHDNMLLTESSLATLPTTIRNLLRWVRQTAVELENHFHGLSAVETGFDDFVNEQLSTKVVIESRQYERESQQVFRSESKESVYQMDIITGRFYVNGKPVGKLPHTITEHADFQRIFSGTIFEAREASPSHIPGSLSTVLKFNMCIYNFFITNEELLVTEIHDDGKKFQLVSHSQLEGDIPFLLVHKFSHWRDLKSNTIVFRPIDFLDPSFTATPEYTLNLGTKELIQNQNQTKRKIVDINTRAYRHIADVMERLEHCDEILVFSDSQKFIAELPRMALHFNVNKSGVIESKEFSGMQVATVQQLETLIGLRNGILLKSIEFDDNTMAPVLLIPNGQVSLSSSGNVHHEVLIATESLGFPEYFAFEVDTRLKRLRAGQSRVGWLYLAYLHAVTASPMPDPFLEMTGTEAALQLLQSPLCWSSEPLENAATDIITRISDLSPGRIFYPPHLEVMERHSYPNYLSSAAAQDSFRIIVQQIISDSQRLTFLFPKSKPVEEETANLKPVTEEPAITRYNDKLCLRAYRRHAHFSNEQCQIDASFVDVPAESPSNLLSSTVTHLHEVNITDVRILAQLSSTWRGSPPTGNSVLTQLLGNESYLENRRIVIDPDFDTQAELIKKEFPNSWFDLYEIARMVNNKSWRSEWSLLLGQLAFGNDTIPLEHLNLLHIIAVNPEVFEDKNLPPYNVYTNTGQHNLNIAEVKSTIKSCAIQFDSYFSRKRDSKLRDSDEQKEYVDHMESVYNSLVNNESEEIARNVASNWPIHSCNGMRCFTSSSEVIDMLKAKTKLNPILANRYENLQLHNFLVEIQELIQLGRWQSGIPEIRPYNFEEFGKYINSISTPSTKEFKEILDKSLDSIILENEDVVDENVYEIASSVFETGRRSNANLIDLASDLDNLTWSPNLSSKTCQAEADYLFNSVKKVILTSTSSLPYKHVLCAAGLFPRLTPTTLIPKICSDELKNTRIRDLLGAVAVLWTLDQKEIRCVKLKHAGSMEFALKKEQENDGHKFKPKERPEWLLLELEMDIMIREIQVQVAERMLHPLDGESSLMQLNMGEGKTSVILPILIASLANGKQLARVTVLKSLFNTNTEVLRFNLGGLLKRRLYNFPCRRDMGIQGPEARAMLKVYEECVNKRGFVVTLPEHRLSFQLKGYEKCRSGSDDAEQLVGVQEWLYENARDVLDESDEILNVKYQLIYTIGEQLPINGGSARWTILQKVLKLIPKQLLSIVNSDTGISDLGECRHIELKSENGPEIFPQCRIFKPQCYEELCTLLVDDILQGKSQVQFPELNSAKQQLVFEFLTKASVTHELHSEVLTLFSPDTVSSAHLDTLLILRGIFACGILHLGLTKRWRVNYGENPKSNEFSRLMAVPYRAKDVASEKTEFGHPDVAILLTQLSYYYSGLSDSQLTDAFVCLFGQPKPDLEYNYWTRKMKNVHPSISSLSGVNLDDYEQRTKILFPSLRRNMFVIDFWLNHFVYPRESKVFGHKLMSTAWDLCSPIAKHLVTGFSGTKDTAMLLPLHISQNNDLPKLMGTDEEVRGYILGVENNHYEALSTGFSGMDILKKLVEMKIPLLLDVGALILELTNVQVAEEWLKLIPDNDKIEAAVYFDSVDRLMVKDRLGRESKLELSPYKTRLGHCVIYLDDVHTRGTDLKMPSETKGCVTLGKGVTRDKLVQGCMRMRLLGKPSGHSLQFLASQEVHNEICAMHTGSELELREIKWNEKVLNWASRNSDIAIKDGFLHWVNAGLNYTRKEMAHFLFNDFPSKTSEDYLSYGDRCSDAEATELMAMYGEFRAEELFFKIAEKRLNYQEKSFLETLNSAERKLKSQIVSKLQARRYAIVEKCQEHIPEVKKLAYLLDEEQERELEHELEEERQAPRPPSAQPWPHKLDPMLKRFVEGGTFASVRSACLMQLPEVFQATKLWSITQPECWGGNIYATQDFFHVVKKSNKIDCVDQFLRPPTWIISFVLPKDIAAGLPNRSGLIYLSPFEANELMPIFRSGKSQSKLHMFAPRLHPKQDTLLLSPELWIPSAAAATILNSREYFAGFNQLNANLIVFSGSQYFANEEEQTSYCQLTGYIPRPRTEAEQKAFDEDWTVNGFVKPEHRRVLNPTLDKSCQFQLNPEKLIFGIIERRHERFSVKCHVSRIVADSTKKSFETIE